MRISSFAWQPLAIFREPAGRRCRSNALEEVKKELGLVNWLTVWFTPPYGKSKRYRHMSYPFCDGKSIATSVEHLVEGRWDGAISAEVDYLDPSFLKRGQPRSRHRCEFCPLETTLIPQATVVRLPPPEPLHDPRNAQHAPATGIRRPRLRDSCNIACLQVDGRAAPVREV